MSVSGMWLCPPMKCKSTNRPDCDARREAKKMGCKGCPGAVEIEGDLMGKVPILRAHDNKDYSKPTSQNSLEVSPTPKAKVIYSKTKLPLVEKFTLSDIQKKIDALVQEKADRIEKIDKQIKALKTTKAIFFEEK